MAWAPHGRVEAGYEYGMAKRAWEGRGRAGQGRVG